MSSGFGHDVDNATLAEEEIVAFLRHTASTCCIAGYRVIIAAAASLGWPCPFALVGGFFMFDTKSLRQSGNAQAVFELFLESPRALEFFSEMLNHFDFCDETIAEIFCNATQHMWRRAPVDSRSLLSLPAPQPT